MSGFSLVSPLRFLQAGTSENSPRREVKSARARELLSVASMNETEVLIYLGSSLEGLDSAEAAARLGKHGANVIAQNGAPNPLRELLDRARTRSMLSYFCWPPFLTASVISTPPS